VEEVMEFAVVMQIGNVELVDTLADFTTLEMGHVIAFNVN
jgi:hypothetical protein